MPHFYFSIVSILFSFGGITRSGILSNRHLLCSTYSTIYGSPLLLPALLTAFRKRRHADTNYIRTAGVFSSRQALLDYEEALALEARIDEALSGQTLAVDQPSIFSRKSQGKGKTKEKTQSLATSPRVEAAKVTREIWTEVYDRWKVLVSITGEQEKPPGLERFDCGMRIPSFSIVSDLLFTTNKDMY